MKKFLILFALFTFLTSTFYSQTESFLWGKNTSGNLFPLDVKLQSNKNIVISGAFNQKTDFDPGVDTAYHEVGSGIYDPYIQILDSNGVYINSAVIKSYPGSTYAIIYDAIIDKNDNIYVTGLCWGTYDFDPGPNQVIEAHPSPRGFVLKLDANCNYLWHHIIDTQNDHSSVTKASMDAQNNLLISGYFRDTLNLIVSGTSRTFVSDFGEDGFTLRYDSQGQILSFTQTESSSAVSCDAIFGKDSSYYFTGIYTDSCSIDFHNGNPPLTLSSPGMNKYLIKTDSLFQPLFVQTFKNNDFSISINNQFVINSQNEIFMVSEFRDTCKINVSGSSLEFVSNGEQDILFTKLNNLGHFVWAKHFGGPGREQVGITLQTNGEPLLYGTYEDSVAFNYDTNGETKFAPQFANSSYFIRANQNGAFNDVRVINHSRNMLREVLVDGPRAYFVGHFRNKIDIDINQDSTFLYTDNPQHNHGMLVKMSTCTPIIEIETVSSCQPYTWIDGNTYAESTNNPQLVFQGSNGCDSIVKLNFTYTPKTGTDQITSCAPYTWIDNNTYNSDTIVSTKVTSANGCDSIVTLQYTKSYQNHTEFITVCGSSYTWRDGQTYTSSTNTPSYTQNSQNACDTIFTLNLTLHQIDQSTDPVTTCQNSYTWIDGIKYTSNNNTASVTLQNINGCDSIVTLDLTFVPGPTSIDEVEACQTYTWIDGQTYTASNSSATHTLTSVDGCDSIVYLDLTIGYPETGTAVISACNEYTWIDGNTYTEDNNTATYTLQSQYGCDSVVTLNLTIDTLDKGLIRSNKTLIASQNNAQYQWINCNNGLPISGATQQFYTAPFDYSFACIVTYNSCTDTTECFDFASLGLDAIAGIDFKIYPNPNAGKFTVDFGQQVESASLKIWSMDGKLVKVIEVTGQSKTEVEYQAAPGVYWLEIDSEMGSRRVRISRF